MITRLRAAIPTITFSTDVIVGFPGETEEQFQETLSLVEAAAFDDAYTFRYSVREGTPAVRLRDQVPDQVASERLTRLIALARHQTRRKNLGRLGELAEVLVEQPAKRGGMLGRTRSNAMVLLDVGPEQVGTYHEVRLTGTTGSTFTGTILAKQAMAVL